jgi:hypothetical protein
MGYMKIQNLYKDTRILEFRKCYALEKIHGTSAHISWKHGNEIKFFSGGEKNSRFVKLFEEVDLLTQIKALGVESITVYGEAYGGRMQGMKETYGKDLRFVAFDVLIGTSWLSVPQADSLVKELGLEFVDYELISTDLESIDAKRDADSTQAIRNGVGEGKHREGVVLRPPFEVTLNSGERLITKHKRETFRETKTKRVVGVQPEVLVAAQAVADEWVTLMRLEHVLQKLPEATGMEHTRNVIKAMIEDVLCEGDGEIVDSKQVRKAVGTAAAKMWKARVKSLGVQRAVKKEGEGK